MRFTPALPIAFRSSKRNFIESRTYRQAPHRLTIETINWLLFSLCLPARRAPVNHIISHHPQISSRSAASLFACSQIRWLFSKIFPFFWKKNKISNKWECENRESRLCGCVISFVQPDRCAFRSLSFGRQCQFLPTHKMLTWTLAKLLWLSTSQSEFTYLLLLLSNRLSFRHLQQNSHPLQSSSTNLNSFDHSDKRKRHRNSPTPADLFMAVDRVKCATLSSATSSSSNSTNSSTNRTSCLRLDCGVMTNVCSPSLAHDAQSQSPTRPESSSPSLDTSADAGAAITSPRSPAPISLNTNSSAMQQQLNKTNDIHSSSADQMDIDGVAGQSNLPTSPIEQQPAMSPNHSPINGSRPEDEQRPKTADADPKPDAVADQEPVSRPSSRDSRTSTNAAASPSSLNHNEASNHSPQPDRDSDRKEVSVCLFFSRKNNDNNRTISRH